MAVNLESIRAAAERVAASHGMDVVEIEYQSGAKQRALRVFVEKNAAERTRLAAAAATQEEPGALPEKVAAGELSIDQLAWVTHEDCERFSRDFGTLLDVEDLVPASEYTLEVSSPGLDRRLLKHADYVRFRGSLLKIQTFAPVAENRHFQGRLAEVGDSSIVLDLSAVKQKGKNKKKVVAQTVELELANVEKANLIPEL
jgi:ribosome maturation factor RimP